MLCFPQSVKTLSLSTGCSSAGSLLGRTNVTVGYRGFWVEGAGNNTFVVRGCQPAEVLLLSILRPSISETVANYIRDEIARDHTGELDLPDMDDSAVETAANCSHQVGPDTVPTYNPSVDDHGCFVSHQSQCLSCFSEQAVPLFPSQHVIA